MAQEQKEKIIELSKSVLGLARDNILMHLRFMDVALAALRPKRSDGSLCVGTDGQRLFYDPVYVLRKYRSEPAWVSRCYLHSLLHLIFYHPFQYEKVEHAWWDLAADLAVENVILEMNLPGMELRCDAELRSILSGMKELLQRQKKGAASVSVNRGTSYASSVTGAQAATRDDAQYRVAGAEGEQGGSDGSARAKALTAEALYKLFCREDLQQDVEELRRLFARDSHTFWEQPEQLEISLAEWKRLSKRIQTDLKTFSKGKGGSNALESNLAEAVKDRYDYSEVLRRFTVVGEELKTNDEEFDYIYYTYGLSTYGDIPLVEPLEYQDTKKIREFVIAIDTSGSCRGKLVRGFLQKTYSILKGTENFFTKIHVHIVQCDNEIEMDTVIRSQEDFDEFLEHGKLRGFGATDFRPVFSYVDQLIAEKSFEDLKGLIYFTDGYGVYPEQMPAYDVIFAFLEEDERRPQLPTWAMQVILEEDELDKAAEEQPT